MPTWNLEEAVHTLMYICIDVVCMQASCACIHYFLIGDAYGIFKRFDYKTPFLFKGGGS